MHWNVCRVLFGKDVSNMSTAELKRDVLVYARNNPQDFLEVINDPELKLMGTIQRFFENGLLKTRKSGKEVWYNTPTNKTKMLNVPYDGIEVLKHLETLLD